jgi:hypothetical protein
MGNRKQRKTQNCLLPDNIGIETDFLKFNNHTTQDKGGGREKSPDTLAGRRK